MRRVYYLPIDALDLLLGRRDVLTPPRGISPGYILSSGFREHGEAFFPHLIDLGGLKPDSCMLDLGCGFGRIAVPVMKYMNANGRYEGLDIVPEAIDWCQKAITSRYPNAHFQLVDVANNHYMPNGVELASRYQFPYESDYFEVVLLKSVFTHMLVDDVENYLGEIARTLKPGGRCMITYFLLNENVLMSMQARKTKRQFPYEFGVYRAEKQNEREAALAYNESFIRRCYQQVGLEIVEPIHCGSWRGDERALFAQDIVIAIKK